MKITKKKETSSENNLTLNYKMMRPLGVKKAVRNVFGSKAVNRGMKFGAKALGYIGDMALPASVLAPEIAPVLETAKLASVGLNLARRGITGRK